MGRSIQTGVESAVTGAAVSASGATPTSAAPALWVATASRAVVALAAGLTITFVSDHSAAFGLLVFAAFAILSALTLAWTARLHTAPAAIWLWIAAAVAGVTGIFGILGVSLTALVTVLIAHTAATGLIEAGLGVRFRGRYPHARDWLVTGILSLITAIAVALIPSDFTNAWETVTKEGDVVSGVVTADVFVVGVFGAYAFVLGVYLAIAAVSLWQSTRHGTTHDQVDPVTVSGER